MSQHHLKPLRRQLWFPLTESNSEVRLLHLNPAGNNQSPLTGRLIVSSLNDHLLYDAISWAWGGPDTMVSITINAVQGWRIPSRLDACLRRLSSLSRGRAFWVDALCVDQLNPTERSAQVKSMDRIFSNAHTVWVWLGSSSEDFGPRLPASLCGTLSEYLSLDTSSLSAKAYAFATSKIVSRALVQDWWSRVWPMQEVVLARDLQLCFDDQVIKVNHLLDMAREIGLGMPQMDELSWLCNFRTRNSHKNNLTAEFTQLIHYSRRRSAFDPRDKVYGILGACTFMFGRDFLQPNYELPVSAVYQQMVSRLLQKKLESPLAYLNQVVPLHHTDPAIPTWVPDLSSRYDHTNELRRLLYQDRYRAASSLESTNFEMDPKPSGEILICYGAHFEMVYEVFELCEVKVEENIEEELRWYTLTIMSWLDRYVNCDVGWPEGAVRETNLEKFAEAMFRYPKENANLVSGETPMQALEDLCALTMFQASEQSRYTPAMAEILSLLDCMESAWLIRQVAMLKGRQPKQRSQSERRERVTKLRDICLTNLAGCRCFVTYGRKLGIGPANTISRDYLAVLIGGNVPYVLRDNATATKTYSFVGECYFQGAMHGEIKKREGEPKRIIIV